MSDLPGLPELLCPAGTPEALDAAIEGGADAVYLGGSSMNARLNAGNFSPTELRDAVRRAHAYGVKVYLTLNTLVTDRELPAFLDAARDAARAGVDALIVADLGGAAAIHRAIPELELHASTQMSGHHSAMGVELKKLGFSRMVAARELPAADLELLVKNSPIEIEIFVHGALCVSHSGQCLFSSVVGGRSGNRGMCAQPCRLPYRCGSCRQGHDGYPLSLKDLSLASHVPELLKIGVSSLKIEGRMKTPEYVFEASRIWRRLLDECRAATSEEMERMSQAFSRSGFTDAYFTGRIGRDMLGVRRESDKQASERLEKFSGLKRSIPLSVHARLSVGNPVCLTLSDGCRTVSVTGDIPQAARTAPLTEASVLRSLCRFGGTPYRAEKVCAEVEPGLMLPVSHLNDLRRRGLEALAAALTPHTRAELPVSLSTFERGRQRVTRTARFRRPEQITPEALRFFDRISLPLPCFALPAAGVILPPVIFDRETASICRMLSAARQAGARYATVGNLGHLALVRDAGLIPLGDFRLNVTNRESAVQYCAQGLEEVLLSPELTLPQLRDIGGDTAVLVYGRIPLMTLEKCVIRELADCRACESGGVRMTDRRGVSFPVMREWKHRNVIYNSLPTGMSDRRERLSECGIANWHFLFSDESCEEVNRVIRAYADGVALPYPVRRI